MAWLSCLGDLSAAANRHLIHLLIVHTIIAKLIDNLLSLLSEMGPLLSRRHCLTLSCLHIHVWVGSWILACRPRRHRRCVEVADGLQRLRQRSWRHLIAESILSSTLVLVQRHQLMGTTQSRDDLSVTSPGSVESTTHLLSLLFIQLLKLLIQFYQILGYGSSLGRPAGSKGRTLWHICRRSYLLLLGVLQLRRRTGVLPRCHIIAHVELIRIVLSRKVVKHVAWIRAGIGSLWVRLLGQVLLDLLLHGLLHLLHASKIRRGSHSELGLCGSQLRIHSILSGISAFLHHVIGL